MKTNWRARIAIAAYAHATRSAPLALVLYVVTTLYFDRVSSTRTSHGQTIETTGRMGTGKEARDRRVVWQYCATREGRDNRTLELQIDRTQAVADGTRLINKDRFVKFVGDLPRIDQALIEEARILLGLRATSSTFRRSSSTAPG